MRSNSAGATARNPSLAYPSATDRMCAFTPKISCTTTSPPIGSPSGRATYALSSCPSEVVSISCSLIRRLPGSLFDNPALHRLLSRASQPGNPYRAPSRQRKPPNLRPIELPMRPAWRPRFPATQHGLSPALHHQRNAMGRMLQQAKPPPFRFIAQAWVNLQADFTFTLEHKRKLVQWQGKPHATRFDVGLFQPPQIQCALRPSSLAQSFKLSELHRRKHPLRNFNNRFRARTRLHIHADLCIFADEANHQSHRIR